MHYINVDHSNQVFFPDYLLRVPANFPAVGVPLNTKHMHLLMNCLL